VSSRTFTRYECDWCGGQIEVTHAGTSVAVAERPSEWASAQLEEERFDLCAYCAEALRALAASRSGTRAQASASANPYSAA